MVNIEKIRDRFKNNLYIILKIDTLYTYNKLEDALLTIGYTWATSRPIGKLIDPIFMNKPNPTLHLNYNGHLNKIFTSNDDKYTILYHFDLTENNIDWFISVLLKKPNYNSKKIIRTI